MEANTEVNVQREAAITNIDLQRDKFIAVLNPYAGLDCPVWHVYGLLYSGGQVTLVMRRVAEVDTEGRKSPISR